MITIQGNGNRKNVMGWCTVNKVWQDTFNNEKKYEIAIIGEYLNRGMHLVLSTLLHEMAHEYNLENKIIDVSRNGTYHNKNFKKTAEEHGLVIEKVGTIGWSKTSLNQFAINLIKKSNLNEEAFSLVRINQSINGDGEEDGEEDGENRVSRSKSIKYVCPICGNTLRANKEINIICGDDNCRFEAKT